MSDKNKYFGFAGKRHLSQDSFRSFEGNLIFAGQEFQINSFIRVQFIELLNHEL